MDNTDVMVQDTKHTTEPELLPLRGAAGGTEYPLAFNQREMWVLCQLQGTSALHNIAVEVTIGGPLDVDRFQEAFTAVIDRHEAMRTAFPAHDGMPVQRIEAMRAQVALRDLSDVPSEAQAACVRARAEALVCVPFALDRAPLFRAELLRLAAERSVLIFVFHNLILDGFYLPQLLEELARTYERLRAGDRSPQPPLALQFGDFAAREERTFDAGLLSGHESHWRAQLRAPLPSMAITGDRRPPAVRTFESRSLTLRLSRDLSAALRSLSRRYETTTFRIVTAAFQVLLWRLTGEADLLLATPFSTRPEEMRDAIGFFGNTLPLRATLDPDRPFDRLVGDVTSAVREARERRTFPLTELFRTLEQQRDPSRPLMPICVAQVRPFAISAGDLRMRVEYLLSGGTTFDLSLLIGDDGEAVDIQLVYAAELFGESTVAAFINALETLLASVAADPEQPIRALEILSAGDRARVEAWGSGGASLAGEDGSLGVELAAVAARVPEAIAVVGSGETWTYARLHEAADRVAAALATAGVGREARVGILGTRSPGMLATAIGALKAGAAFVPLEASQPDARLQAIAQAAAVTAVVADRASLGRVRTLVAAVRPAVQVLCWDDVVSDTGYTPMRAVAGGPTDLAYIFYTSGSTGTPKGAMVEQRGLRNHLRAKIAALALDATSAVVQNASYGFDIIVWQWLTPLLVGGRVVIYDEATAEDPAALLAALERDAATVVETVPSFLEAMLEAADAHPASRLPALRWLISNAEVLPPEVARRWLARYPAVRLMNAYGPTECSDDTMHADVTAGELPAALARVPIGQPLPGSTVAVVDELLRPVPPGCVGEIVIGGVPVGRGYLGDATATARTFVPDMRSASAGGRLYRTGDRGRWRPDGMLECLGRKDDQVKLHGYRVELGDVEAALAMVPELSQVAAAVRTDARGQRRLVAYYVAPAACDAAVVRRSLAARLPAYMVPNAIVRLPAMPLTRTGKLDRNALPAPPEAESTAQHERAATPLEVVLADVWQQVLDVPAVGRHDNFFDLGGDSIQCIRVVSRLNQRGFRLSPRAVFAHQTIADLGRLIEQSEPPSGDGDLASGPPPQPSVEQQRVGRGALVAGDAEDVYPLAPIQEGMLFHAILEPESSLYYEQAHFALDGPLDVGAFQHAWDHLVAEHPVLRTVIRWEGLPEPVQVVQAPRSVPVRIIDVAHLPPPEQESRMAREADEEWARRFPLDRGPLVRLALFVLDAGRFRFMWTFHHILLDGWSGTSLLRDLARAYEALVDHGSPVVSRVRPYRDLVTWLRAQDRTEALEFWRRQLAGFESPTPLPRDRPAGATRRRDAADVTVALAPEVTRLLERWARAERVTMSALLRAAWGILLARMGGTSDVVFGATVSGRPAELGGVEQIVGPFINAVPVRVRVGRAQTIAEVAKQVHAQSVEAGAFEYLPLPDVQKASTVPADRPLFDSLFAYENFPIDERPRSIGGVEIRVLHGRELTHYDLTMYAIPAGVLELRLAYAVDVFDRPTVERMANGVAHMLTAFAADPQVRAWEAPLLSAEDAARVEIWGNGCAGEAAAVGSVGAELAAVAARTPSAVAVVAGPERWTHSQLQAAAESMAAALRAARAGRESRVGILGTRSPGMLAAVIGTLHAGSAFVPLEGGHPDARLRTILEAGELTAIASDRAAFPRAERLVAGLMPAPALLCWDDLPAPAGAAAPEIGGPADLAYIFFTSGSTGTPKGVMVEQRAMRNHLRAKIAALELDATSVVVQNASYGFDIVVWQWLAALLVGGRVVIYDEATAEDPAALLAALARDGATVVETVPSFLEALVEAAGRPAAPSLPALRWMVSNAEALPPAVAHRWRACYPTVRLLNTYGATECADDTTHGEVQTGAETADRVPVGRAIPGVTVAVVDAALRPVPPGCVGEIVLGGVAVGRGYLGDPAATARAFVPDPRSVTPGARLYCTGDRGRWTTTGALACLGRHDDQVKVRGYRVELGDVEAALAALPDFSQVAAAARTDEQGEPRLVAYYVAPDPCDAAAVRKALTSRLPSYMVPDAIVRLASLPRTLTGKLDRSALPAPPAREPAAASDGPATPLETIVAAVWQQVLQRPFVGRHDNFFELGGHSLTAIRIIAALKERIGRRVPIRQLFSTPTVAEFAAAIDQASADAAPALARVPERAWYPLSSAQRAQWIAQHMTDGREWYSPRVLEFDGELDRAAFSSALQALVDRHDALRTTFAERDGDVVQIVADRYELPWRFEDLSDLAPAERDLRVRGALEEESRRPFELLRLPLLELRLLRLLPDRHLLIFRLPHIVTDGWTEGILVTDLAELYNAHHAGRAASLPPLTVRHVDVCAREPEWLGTPALASQKAYWLDRFAGDIPALHLPTDPRANEGVEHRTAFATALVGEDTISALRELAAAHGVTLFVTLLSVFEVLAARLSGQTDFAVATPIAGRGRAELERVAGLFANLLPLRTSLAGNPSFVEILGRVSRTTVAGLTNQDYPFHRWIEEVRRPASHRARLFSALFVVHEEAFRPAFDGVSARWFNSEAFGASLFSRSLPWYPEGVAFYGSDTGSGWRVTMLGDSNAFGEESLHHMVEQWLAIARQVVADPDRRLADVEVPAGAATPGSAYATVALDRDEIDRLFA